MFNVGAGEIMVILVLALIVLGPDKLPSAARQAGKYLSEFRRISDGFQRELRDAMDLDDLKPKTATMAPARVIETDNGPTLPPADPTVEPPADSTPDAPTDPIVDPPTDTSERPALLPKPAIQVEGPPTSFG